MKNLSEIILRPDNRIDELIGYIEKHREHIPPYTLRAELKFKNSSNRGEKANEFVIAQRQKHNGMSWSLSGSGTPTQVIAPVMNNELHSWMNAIASTAQSAMTA